MNQEIFTDETINPTDPYKGMKLKEIPASYLIWRNDVIGIDRKSEMGIYITENIDSIRERNEKEKQIK